MRQRVVSIISDGEHVRRELEGLLPTVQLDVLLGVNGDVLERVHRHNHIPDVRLQTDQETKTKRGSVNTSFTILLVRTLKDHGGAQSNHHILTQKAPNKIKIKNKKLCQKNKVSFLNFSPNNKN